VLASQCSSPFSGRYHQDGIEQEHIAAVGLHYATRSSFLHGGALELLYPSKVYEWHYGATWDEPQRGPRYQYHTCNIAAGQYAVHGRAGTSVVFRNVELHHRMQMLYHTDARPPPPPVWPPPKSSTASKGERPPPPQQQQQQQQQPQQQKTPRSQEQEPGGDDAVPLVYAYAGSWGFPTDPSVVLAPTPAVPLPDKEWSYNADYDAYRADRARKKKENEAAAAAAHLRHRDGDAAAAAAAPAVPDRSAREEKVVLTYSLQYVERKDVVKTIAPATSSSSCSSSSSSPSSSASSPLAAPPASSLAPTAASAASSPPSSSPSTTKADSDAVGERMFIAFFVVDPARPLAYTSRTILSAHQLTPLLTAVALAPAGEVLDLMLSYYGCLTWREAVERRRAIRAQRSVRLLHRWHTALD